MAFARWPGVVLVLLVLLVPVLFLVVLMVLGLALLEGGQGAEEGWATRVSRSRCA